ncbi:MAG: hypothetical protein ACKOE3_04210, partial [Betaproteobacteria bacterium]
MNPARFSLSHSPLIGWGLAVAAIAIGYTQYGWPGVFLAFTVIVFWLLLQFSRALRVMRAAATNPVASVDRALMAQPRIHPGMKMLQVLRETRSLGQRLAHPSPGAHESWEWRDRGVHAQEMGPYAAPLGEVHHQGVPAPVTPLPALVGPGAGMGQPLAQTAGFAQHL